MKTITRDQLERIANSYGMSFDIDECSSNPSIYEMHKGKAYGFEATEVDGDNLGGFRFFGDAKFQSKLMDVWNEITNPVVLKPMLTIEAAQQLIGKVVTVSYSDVNNGTEKFEIVRLEKVPSNQIGQTENFILITKDFEILSYGDKNTPEVFGQKSEKESNWVYEWQGIFRRGSGAERLFIEVVE
jgi:hypothetical protein